MQPDTGISDIHLSCIANIPQKQGLLSGPVSTLVQHQSWPARQSLAVSTHSGASMDSMNRLSVCTASRCLSDLYAGSSRQSQETRVMTARCPSSYRPWKFSSARFSDYGMRHSCTRLRISVSAFTVCDWMSDGWAPSQVCAAQVCAPVVFGTLGGQAPGCRTWIRTIPIRTSHADNQINPRSGVYRQRYNVYHK